MKTSGYSYKVKAEHEVVYPPGRPGMRICIQRVLSNQGRTVVAEACVTERRSYRTICGAVALAAALVANAACVVHTCDVTGASAVIVQVLAIMIAISGVAIVVYAFKHSSWTFHDSHRSAHEALNAVDDAPVLECDPEPRMPEIDWGTRMLVDGRGQALHLNPDARDLPTL